MNRSFFKPYYSVSSGLMALVLSCLFLALVVTGENTVLAKQNAKAEQQVGKPADSAGDAATGESAKDDEASEVSIADKAFAAYQRGEYLTAFSFALKGAQEGDPAAQTLVALLYDRGLGVAQNEKEAAQWYKIAAGAGNREAQFAYAVKLMEGKAIKRDEKAAMAMMKKAADQGHGVAQFNYARFLLDANPGSPGIKLALPYLEGAAREGVAEAAYSLALIKLKGSGDYLPDVEGALKWMRIAANNGLDIAQIELALWQINGTVGEKNLEEGSKWMKRAAERGNAIAQNRLAHMYMSGLGVERDETRAAFWYLLSARAGKSDVELQDFYTRLSPDIRRKAQKLLIQNRHK